MKNMRINIKKLIFVLAVAGIVIIDVFKTNAGYESAAIAVNCIGFCIFPFVAVRFKWSDFKKPCYYIWGAIAGALIYPAYRFFASYDVFPSRFLVAEFNVWLYGFLIIRILIMLFKEQKGQKIRRMSLTFYGFIIMMMLCVLSVNRAVWPLWYLMMFSTYYLAPATKDELSDIFTSLINGIIVAFFILQSMAFLYRPYWITRYRGFFYNSNLNALFYFVTYIAVLLKLHELREKQVKRAVRILFFILACGLWSFMIFTICRSAMIGFVVVTVIYLIVEEFIYKKRGIKGFLISGIMMFLVFILSLYPVYACIRYIPQLRHHPINFQDEEYSSIYINDEDMYVSFTTVLSGVIGRLDYDKNKEYVEGHAENYEDSGELVTEESTEAAVYKEVSYGKLDVILGIRKYIWKYYGSNLKFIGHQESYEQVQITPAFACNHPHNSFLFIAYSFGIIPGVLFLIFSVAVPIYALVMYKRRKDELPWYWLYTALIFVAFICFGFFETVSYPGRAIFSLLFMTSIILMQSKGQNEKTV